MAVIIVKTLDLDLLINDEFIFPLQVSDASEIPTEYRDEVYLVNNLDIMNGDGEYTSYQKMN
ncbi:hypothetical protein [Natranaerobius trueperi]|uniref:Uncharacterized protein n=1 Tax=Natranaerobius trueperi TaxID=759412 RepID=A0A226C1B9_9FIRM|nr:hypothetical protein CDO51_01045 [Natranaerobius trueperi]